MTDESKAVKRLKHLLTYENLWLYVLSIIKKNKTAYAYALDEQIANVFGFRPNKIVGYIVLYKLEREGLISSKLIERRKYYEITKKGEESLEKAREYIRMLRDRL